MAGAVPNEEAETGGSMDATLSRSLLLSLPSAVCVVDGEGKILGNYSAI